MELSHLPQRATLMKQTTLGSIHRSIPPATRYDRAWVPQPSFQSSKTDRGREHYGTTSLPSPSPARVTNLECEFSSRKEPRIRGRIEGFYPPPRLQRSADLYQQLGRKDAPELELAPLNAQRSKSTSGAGSSWRPFYGEDDDDSSSHGTATSTVVIRDLTLNLFPPRRANPWVYRYKVKRNMNIISQILEKTNNNVPSKPKTTL